MNKIEQKALALVNEVRKERRLGCYFSVSRETSRNDEALCRAIEQLEAYKQEVSDKLEFWMNPNHQSWEEFAQFIIPKPKPKPDPLVEVIKAMQAEPTTYVTTEVYANRVNAALDALGFEIREKGQ